MSHDDILTLANPLVLLIEVPWTENQVTAPRSTRGLLVTLEQAAFVLCLTNTISIDELEQSDKLVCVAHLGPLLSFTFRVQFISRGRTADKITRECGKFFVHATLRHCRDVS